MLVNKSKLLNFKPIRERLSYLQIKEGSQIISILNVHASIEEKEHNNEKYDFYENLENPYDVVPQGVIIIVMGDMNTN